MSSSNPSPQSLGIYGEQEAERLETPEVMDDSKKQCLPDIRTYAHINSYVVWESVVAKIRNAQLQARPGPSTEGGKWTWDPIPNKDAMLSVTDTFLAKEKSAISNEVPLSISTILQGRPNTKQTQ